MTIMFCGDVTRKEDTVKLDGEAYDVHLAEYTMIKLISESGYALVHLVERLTVDLGLRIRLKQWTFHRDSEG